MERNDIAIKKTVNLYRRSYIFLTFPQQPYIDGAVYTKVGTNAMLIEYAFIVPKVGLRLLKFFQKQPLTKFGTKIVFSKRKKKSVCFQNHGSKIA